MVVSGRRRRRRRRRSGGAVGRVAAPYEIVENRNRTDKLMEISLCDAR
jgi:hypothetical protein